MNRPRRHEAESNHDRWTVSYADFMTLLFALFVVLFASSQHDKRAVQRVSSAVKAGFTEGAVAGATVASAFAPTGPGRTGPVTISAGVNVVDLQNDLRGALGKEIERKEVVLRMTPEGFVISLRELGFFESGKAELLPRAAGKVRRIGDVLMKYGLDMRVEGHTDDVPIHNASFDSNWELSTARANSVAMMLIDRSGFDPARLSIAGYGEYHPVGPNATAEGRQANRRVDIVIVSTQAASKR